MFYTYVLRCIKQLKSNKFYIGSTKDLKKRIADHRNKSNKTTKEFDQIELIYYEACRSKMDAISREHQLKTGFGRGYLKNRLKNDTRVWFNGRMRPSQG